MALLYERWAPRVRRFAGARLGDPDEAEDVAQEVFAALLRRRSSYEGRSAFGTWILGVAHHVTCRVHRRRRRELLVDAEGEADCGSGAAEASLDAARALEGCARWLEEHGSARQARAFWLTYRDGLPGARVAAELRCSPESVRAQLHRLRKLLLAGDPGLRETLGAAGAAPAPLGLEG